MTGEIEAMHLDCSGAAVTLASIKALAALKVKANIVATLSVAENMIGPHAQKPLAIWPTVRGTVQITNTSQPRHTARNLHGTAERLRPPPSLTIVRL